MTYLNYDISNLQTVPDLQVVVLTAGVVFHSEVGDVEENLVSGGNVDDPDALSLVRIVPGVVGTSDHPCQGSQGRSTHFK